MGLSCTHQPCYPMTPTHHRLGLLPAGRPPTGHHPSTCPTLRTMAAPMANPRLRLHPALVPAGAIGPATPVAPFQSLLSHVTVAAMLVSTAGPATGAEMKCEVCRDRDGKREGERRRNKKSGRDRLRGMGKTCSRREQTYLYAHQERGEDRRKARESRARYIFWLHSTPHSPGVGWTVRKGT